MVMASRRDEVIELKKAGLSYAEIGRRLGISRERARQLATPEKPPSDVALTQRERQILAFIAQGYTTKGIAAALSIEPHTVNNQVWCMEKRLGAKNRVQLVTLLLPANSVASREITRQIIKGKPTSQKPDKLMLTTGGVAQLLGVHPNTVRHWSENGILKSYRIGPRGDRRFRWEDVDDFLKEGEIRKVLKREVSNARSKMSQV